MSNKLTFCFKGSRTYVQGPDIVAALFKHFSGQSVTDIDIKFNGITSANLNLVEGDSADNSKVNIRCNLNGENKVFQLIENSEVIDCRYEYDEESLVAHCDLDLSHQQVHLKQITAFTLCENFVAMNKFLLQCLYPEEKGKWYFTRLEQAKIVDDSTLITVKLIKNFNFRLTKSDIFIDDKKIGSVYFTMVRG